MDELDLSTATPGQMARLRLECLKIAIVSGSDSGQAIVDAEKFWLFVTGQGPRVRGR